MSLLEPYDTFYSWDMPHCSTPMTVVYREGVPRVVYQGGIQDGYMYYPGHTPNIASGLVVYGCRED